MYMCIILNKIKKFNKEATWFYEVEQDYFEKNYDLNIPNSQSIFTSVDFWKYFFCQ